MRHLKRIPVAAAQRNDSATRRQRRYALLHGNFGDPRRRARFGEGGRDCLQTSRTVGVQDRQPSRLLLDPEEARIVHGDRRPHGEYFGEGHIGGRVARRVGASDERNDTERASPRCERRRNVGGEAQRLQELQVAGILGDCIEYLVGDFRVVDRGA
ncbi:MAG: hypothetical protein HYX51_07220 [Chloroflexi bacterium]|nr:hypothetical protein [Chloroflexota bacterium]